MEPRAVTVYTIGHSTHPTEDFLALLHQRGITALCDVRSAPYLLQTETVVLGQRI